MYASLSTTPTQRTSPPSSPSLWTTRIHGSGTQSSKKRSAQSQIDCICRDISSVLSQYGLELLKISSDQLFTSKEEGATVSKLGITAERKKPECEAPGSVAIGMPISKDNGPTWTPSERWSLQALPRSQSPMNTLELGLETTELSPDISFLNASPETLSPGSLFAGEWRDLVRPEACTTPTKPRSSTTFLDRMEEPYGSTDMTPVCTKLFF